MGAYLLEIKCMAQKIILILNLNQND